MSAQIITVAQQKGGAGKTTTVAHLAVALSQYGLNVAVIDIDPQGSLTHWFKIRKSLQTNVVPLTHVRCNGTSMQSAIEKLKDEQDFILIDSPPHADGDAKRAIKACDLVMVPMQPSPLDLWATQATLKIAKQLSKPVKMVLNRVNPKAKLSQRMQEELEDMSLCLFGNRVVYAGALMAGKGVTEMAGDTSAAKETEKLAEEILDYFGYEVEEEEISAEYA
ncbi:MAG: ParA family protein [Rickettsiales bacterium]|nr:ParA family protein [Rickettsiales bacterium]